MALNDSVQTKRQKFLKYIAEDYVYNVAEGLPFDISQYDLTTREIKIVEHLKERISLMIEADIAYDDAKARGEVRDYEDFDFSKFGLTPDEIKEMESLDEPFKIIRQDMEAIKREESI